MEESCISYKTGSQVHPGAYIPNMILNALIHWYNKIQISNPACQYLAWHNLTIIQWYFPLSFTIWYKINTHLHCQPPSHHVHWIRGWHCDNPSGCSSSQTQNRSEFSISCKQHNMSRVQEIWGIINAEQFDHSIFLSVRITIAKISNVRIFFVCTSHDCSSLKCWHSKH